MTPSHSKVAAVTLLILTLLAQLTNWVHGNPAAMKQLERVLRGAEEESKQLAKEINDWINGQPFDNGGHLRVRKSTEEEENGEKTAEAQRNVHGTNSTTTTKKKREARESKLQREFTKVRRKVMTNQQKRKSHHNTEKTATHKRRSNPVLQAFDLMKLLIREREKSLKKTKMPKVREQTNKTSRKTVKRGRRPKKGKANKRERFAGQKKWTKYSSRSATKGSKKFKVLRRTRSGKVASHSNIKRKLKYRKTATNTQNVVQILKAMPRKELRKFLKEKGLGKVWNVIKLAPKKSLHWKSRGKKSMKATGKTTKRTHSNEARKDGKRNKKATRSEKRAHIHKKKSKLAYGKVTRKQTKSKSSATRPSVSEKRTNIPKAQSKVHYFHGKKADSRKRKEVHANAKFAALKNKIMRTNELKFKVAKALLAHCATENKLRNIFRDVNMSLKKAAVLVEIIGRRLGIEKGDMKEITKQHPEKTVQQFLSEVF